MCWSSYELCCDGQGCGVSLVLRYEGEVQAPQLRQVCYEGGSVGPPAWHGVTVEGQSGQHPQSPEGLQDRPVSQFVAVEVEQSRHDHHNQLLLIFHIWPQSREVRDGSVSAELRDVVEGEVQPGEGAHADDDLVLLEIGQDFAQSSQGVYIAVWQPHVLGPVSVISEIFLQVSIIRSKVEGSNLTDWDTSRDANASWPTWCILRKRNQCPRLACLNLEWRRKTNRISWSSSERSNVMKHGTILFLLTSISKVKLVRNYYWLPSRESTQGMANKKK